MCAHLVSMEQRDSRLAGPLAPLRVSPIRRASFTLVVAIVPRVAVLIDARHTSSHWPAQRIAVHQRSWFWWVLRHVWPGSFRTISRPPVCLLAQLRDQLITICIQAIIWILVNTDNRVVLGIPVRASGRCLIACSELLTTIHIGCLRREWNSDADVPIGGCLPICLNHWMIALGMFEYSASGLGPTHSILTSSQDQIETVAI